MFFYYIHGLSSWWKQAVWKPWQEITEIISDRVYKVHCVIVCVRVCFCFHWLSMIDDFSSIVFHFELIPVSWKYFYFELCNEISLPSSHSGERKIALLGVFRRVRRRAPQNARHCETRLTMAWSLYLHSKSRFDEFPRWLGDLTGEVRVGRLSSYLEKGRHGFKIRPRWLSC